VNLPVEVDPDLGDLNVNRFQGTIQVVDPDGVGTEFEGIGQLDADATAPADGGAAGWYDALSIGDACQAILNVRDDEVDLRIGRVTVADSGDTNEAAATLTNDTNAGAQEDHIWVGDVDTDDTQGATLAITGANTTQLVGQVGSGVTLSLQSDAVLTGNFGFSGGDMTIEGGGRANVYKTMTGDNITVKGLGTLAVADAGFTQGTLKVEDGGLVALAVDVDYSDAAAATSPTYATGVVIAKEAYSGTLTLTHGTTAIASEWTPLAGIAAPLAGSATQVNFLGTADSLMLTLEGDGIVTDLGGPTAVVVDHDLRITGAQSYSNGTTLSSGTVHVLDDDALGTGTVSIEAPSDDPKEVSTLVLHDDADGGANFSAPITLTAASEALFSSVVLDLRAETVDSALTLAGGTVRAETSSTVTGALTDSFDMVFSAGETLTFSHAAGIDLNASGLSRIWTVEDGTVVFSGDVNDGDASGPHGLSKRGAGTLRLDGGASGVDTLVAGGTVAGGQTDELGGLVLIGDETKLPTTVQIGEKSAYGVSADHAYGEVDLNNADGAIAIGADTTATLDLSGYGTSLSLGSAGDYTFSGTLVPSYDTYYLGGGGGTLRMAPGVLVDVDYMYDPAVDPTNLQIGRDGGAPDNMAHAGTVVLQGDTAEAGVTGDIKIYGYAGIEADPLSGTGDALAAIDDAAGRGLHRHHHAGRRRGPGRRHHRRSHRRDPLGRAQPLQPADHRRHRHRRRGGRHDDRPERRHRRRHLREDRSGRRPPRHP